jgi:peptidoglycan/xylan/chitin deacetylase (PgdA/CDA1 family)
VPSLALTFDDGPDAAGTPLILEALARTQAPATFFVIGRQAARNGPLIERIIEAGHAIGLHCDEHVRHSERDAAWCRADTARALGTLADLGVTPRLWRTPWGDTAPWTAEIAHQHGLRLVGWTCDTHDWRGDTAQEMLAATADGLRDEAIVLAHDGIGPGARRADVRETADYVARAADHAHAAGLDLAALT